MITNLENQKSIPEQKTRHSTTTHTPPQPLLSQQSYQIVQISLPLQFTEIFVEEILIRFVDAVRFCFASSSFYVVFYC